MAIVFACGMLVAIAFAFRARITWTRLTRLALAAVAFLLLTTNVFSPLYIAWLMPLIALVQTDDGGRKILFALGTAVGTLTTILTVLTLGPGTAGFAVVGLRAAIMCGLIGLLVSRDRSTG